MENAWNVRWNDGEKIVIKVFEGDSPKGSGAVPFAADLRKHGFHVDVISRRRAFPPPAKYAAPDQIGMLWCPYCVKWRAFEESAIRRAEYTTPVLLRCTICTISVMDFYVRHYNPIFTERYFTAKEMRQNPQQNGKQVVNARRRR